MSYIYTTLIHIKREVFKSLYRYSNILSTQAMKICPEVCLLSDEYIHLKCNVIQITKCLKYSANEQQECFRSIRRFTQNVTFYNFSCSKCPKQRSQKALKSFGYFPKARGRKLRDCLMRVEFPWSNKTCIMFYKFITEEEALDLEKPSLQRTLQKDWHSRIRYNAGALPCYKLLYRSKGF